MGPQGLVNNSLRLMGAQIFQIVVKFGLMTIFLRYRLALYQQERKWGFFNQAHCLQTQCWNVALPRDKFYLKNDPYNAMMKPGRGFTWCSIASEFIRRHGEKGGISKSDCAGPNWLFDVSFVGKIHHQGVLIKFDELNARLRNLCCGFAMFFFWRLLLITPILLQSRKSLLYAQEYRTIQIVQDILMVLLMAPNIPFSAEIIRWLIRTRN